MVVYMCVVDGIVRYIGITNNFKRRKMEHMSKSRTLYTKNAFYKFLNKRIIENSEIEWYTYCEVDSISDAATIEINLIQKYGKVLNKTGTLLNDTDGGEGGTTGRVMLDSTREKLKKIWTPEKRLMQSEISKKLWTDEKRKECSNRFSGDGSYTAKVTWDFVKKIRDEFTGEHGEVAILTRKYNVSNDIIIGIVDNTTWEVPEMYWSVRQKVRPKGMNYTYKITDNDVIIIRKLYQGLTGNFKNIEIAKFISSKFNITYRYCSEILSNKFYQCDINWWGYEAELKFTSKAMRGKIIHDLSKYTTPNIRKYSKTINMKYHTVYNIWRKYKDNE